MAFDSKIDRDFLIELVRDEPRLWDQRVKAYHNRDLKPGLWEDIGYKLHVKGNIAKKTWENLRDSYRKKLKARNETRSGQEADNSDEKWPFYASMDFLRDILIPREGSGNLLYSTKAVSSSPINEEEVEEPVILDDQFNDSPPSGCISVPSVTNTRESASKETVNLHVKSTETRNKVAKPLKRKADIIRYQALDLERQKVKLLEERFSGKTRKEDDEDYLFLMSLLPSIKKLDSIQKIRLRMSMLESVTLELERKSFRGTNSNGGVTSSYSGSSAPILTTSSLSPHYFVNSPTDSYSSQSTLLPNQAISVLEPPQLMLPNTLLNI